MKVSWSFGVLGAIACVLGAPRSRSLGESNAERLARGLQPNKPARLYSPSRRGALVPRQSGSLPDPNPGFTIVSTNTQPQNPPRRKRAPATYAEGYIGVGTNGNLIYSSSQADAQRFFWGETVGNSAPAALFWTATFTNTLDGVDIQLGTTYPVIARPVQTPQNGLAPIWNLVVGTPLGGDYVAPFAGPRFTGDVNARPIDNDFIVFSFGDIENEQPGTIGITNDFASVKAYLQETESALQPQEILMQTLPTSSPWSMANAIAWYLKGTQFVNPVRVHGTDFAGQVGGWATMAGFLFLQGPDNGAKVFYLPLLNSGQTNMPFIYPSGELSCTIGQFAGGEGIVTVQAIEYEDAQTTQYLAVSVSSQAGRITVPAFPGANSIYGTTSLSPTPVALSNEPALFDVSEFPTAQPICLETVSINGFPSACTGYMQSQESVLFPGNIFVDPMSLYISDPTDQASGYVNLAGPVENGAVISLGSDTPYTSFSILSFASPSDPVTLYSYYQNTPVSYYFTDDSGIPTAYDFGEPQPDGSTSVQFFLPAGFGPNQGGLLQVNGGRFWSNVENGKPTLVLSATSPGANANEVCAELVPPGRGPVYCIIT